MSIVGGEETVIGNAKRVQDHLLSPVESAEQALDATDDGASCFRNEVRLTVTLS